MLKPNHIGVSTTFKIKYAYEKGKKVVFVEDNDSVRNFKDRWGLVSFPCEIGIL